MREKLVIIVGSGFSAEFGLPTTEKLANVFLKTPQDGVLDIRIEEQITRILTDFWVDVFGFSKRKNRPSLEDHFTILDLTANSGHHLGPKYSPKKLRAIRRMSIHRIFQILDQPSVQNNTVIDYLLSLTNDFDLTIVSMNWDIVIEKLLYVKGINYGIEVKPLEDTFVYPNGSLLLKMHGSSNWIYCDSCHRLFGGAEKSALHRKAFLEEDDLKLFDFPETLLYEIDGMEMLRTCDICSNKMAGRVATFSYRKAFSINQFQTIWNSAFQKLSESGKWLFIGYSLLSADYEFRHLLKESQFARKETDRLQCEFVVKKDKNALINYKNFFGTENTGYFNEGLASFISDPNKIF